MSDQYRVLAINPGSTSTKIAVYQGEDCLFMENISHSREELGHYARVTDQFDFRLAVLKNVVEERGYPLDSFAAIVGRGGLLRPLAGGTYAVNEVMLTDLRNGVQGEHPSNLGGLLAHKIGQEHGLPAFVVDPVAVDELEPVARISGFKPIKRRSLGHALNIRRVARLAAGELGRDVNETNLVLAHLGGGISVYAQKQGRLVDVDNSNHEGPFSPERSGGLSTSDVIDLCYSGQYSKGELKNQILRQGGVYSYLGTTNMQEVEARLESGDQEAQLILEAMVLQIAKSIASMATVLSGAVDAIVLTGGIAHSQLITGMIRQRVEFIAPIQVYPGEAEMVALAQGALRVLQGEEVAKTYQPEEV